MSSFVSCVTQVAPRKMGANTACTPAATWVRNCGIEITSAAVSPYGTDSDWPAAYRVFWLCTTPFGWPVVPEVKTSRAGSSGPDGGPGSGRRCSQAVSTKNSVKSMAPVRAALPITIRCSSVGGATLASIWS